MDLTRGVEHFPWARFNEAEARAPDAAMLQALAYQGNLATFSTDSPRQ